MADQATREANLQALEEAANEYLTLEENRLKRENQFLRSVMSNRGLRATAALNLADAGSLAQRRLSDFLSNGNGSTT